MTQLHGEKPKIFVIDMNLTNFYSCNLKDFEKRI